MKFSIVVPSYNQGEYIGSTLDSVLTQSGSDFSLEVLVYDGGSGDGTVDVLRKYKSDKRLHWISRPDRGQANAINQGLKAAKGDILAYLNSDDVYYPETLARVADHFRANPKCWALYGDAQHLHADGSVMGAYITEDWNYARLLDTCYICQPAVFWRRGVTRRCGLFDEKLHYALDYDYWLRIGRTVAFDHLRGRVLAGSRLHAQTKTLRRRLSVHRETLQVVRRYEPKPYKWLRALAHLIAERRNPRHRENAAQRRRYLSHFVDRALHYARKMDIEVDEEFSRELQWRRLEADCISGYPDECPTPDGGWLDPRNLAAMQRLTDNPAPFARREPAWVLRATLNDASATVKPTAASSSAASDLSIGPDDLSDYFESGRRRLEWLWERLRQQQARIPSGLGESDTKALDFGCGAGRMTQALGRYYREVIGVDFSREIIDLARRHQPAPDSGEPGRCQYLAVGEESEPLIPLASGSFDLVFCDGEAFEALPTVLARRYLLELLRLLKPGALLVCRLPSGELALPEAPGAAVAEAFDCHSPRRAALAPLPQAGFRAGLRCPAWKLEMTEGSTLEVPLRLVNLSSVPWPAVGLSDGTYRVAVGNHWLSRDGRVLLLQDDGRAHLSHDLDPESWADLALRVTAPCPGDYVVEFDAVQEHISWFQEQGSAALRLAVKVVAAQPGSDSIGWLSPAPRPLPRVTEGAPLSKEEITALLLSAGGRVFAPIEDDPREAAEQQDGGASSKGCIYLFQKASVELVPETEATARTAAQWGQVLSHYQGINKTLMERIASLESQLEQPPAPKWKTALMSLLKKGRCGIICWNSKRSVRVLL
jgi:glycosyltransferase involved in cell wall biosynthesis/SAM-dependent methyltransferase